MTTAGIWIGTLMMALGFIWLYRAALVPLSQSMRRPARWCPQCYKTTDRGGLFRGLVTLEEVCEDCDEDAPLGIGL